MFAQPGDRPIVESLHRCHAVGRELSATAYAWCDTDRGARISEWRGVGGAGLLILAGFHTTGHRPRRGASCPDAYGLPCTVTDTARGHGDAPVPSAAGATPSAVL